MCRKNGERYNEACVRKKSNLVGKNPLCSRSFMACFSQLTLNVTQHSQSTPTPKAATASQSVQLLPSELPPNLIAQGNKILYTLGHTRIKFTHSINIYKVMKTHIFCLQVSDLVSDSSTLVTSDHHNKSY